MSNYRTHDIVWMAEAFRALANPHRLRIFLRLVDCCGPGARVCHEEEVPCCVGDLGRDLTVAPSTVSHHLKELRRAGLIEMERKGRTIECRVDPRLLTELGEFFRLPPGKEGRES